LDEIRLSALNLETIFSIFAISEFEARSIAKLLLDGWSVDGKGHKFFSEMIEDLLFLGKRLVLLVSVVSMLVVLVKLGEVGNPSSKVSMAYGIGDFCDNWNVHFIDLLKSFDRLMRLETKAV
jgi:hypothetical protein